MGQQLTGSRLGRRTFYGLAGLAVLAGSLSIGSSPTGAIVPGPNGKIVFESNRDGDNDIWVMNPDGTVPENLTDQHGSDVFPAWSADATQIAFSSDRAERLNADVYVMDADGRNPRRLTTTPGEDRGVSWTTDGRIVFHSTRAANEDHVFEVFIMDADGKNQTQLTTEGGSAAYACGDSVNGTIVFNSNRPQPDDIDVTGDGIPDPDFDIYTMDMDGSNVRNVTDNQIFDSGPKFSPDCRRISYNSSDAGGSLDIYRINASGTGVRQLTNTPGVFDAFSAWSPDNTRILFTSNRIHPGSPEGDLEIYTANASNGGAVEQLTANAFGQAELRGDWGTAPPVPVVGPPTKRAECERGGWRTFNNPFFESEQECIKFVNENSQP